VGWMSRCTKIGRGAHGFCKREAFKDHANLMRRASRISTGESWAGRGVGVSLVIGEKGLGYRA
jgi:hypothetical protein